MSEIKKESRSAEVATTDVEVPAPTTITVTDPEGNESTQELRPDDAAQITQRLAAEQVAPVHEAVGHGEGSNPKPLTDEEKEADQAEYERRTQQPETGRSSKDDKAAAKSS